MTIETPPDGTYGARMPGGRLLRFGSRMASGMYRRFGGRGSRELLLLTTVGARSGQQRTTALRHLVRNRGARRGDDRQPAAEADAHQADLPIHRQLRLRRQPARRCLDRVRNRRCDLEARQFGKYETATDREIPVVRLTREG